MDNDNAMIKALIDSDIAAAGCSNIDEYVSGLPAYYPQEYRDKLKAVYLECSSADK